MNERLERAVAMAAEFLREAREDLHFAAILASETDQPRRSGSLSRAATTSKHLAGELIGAWVAAQKSEPKATKLVGATLEPGATLVYVPPEQATFHRGTTALQMPAATPPEVVDVLFSIARPLDLASDTVWPIESLAREVREQVAQPRRALAVKDRATVAAIAEGLDTDPSDHARIIREFEELAGDAVHNDEVARGKVSIEDVCRALGIDAWIHERVLGDDESRPATREEIITKLNGIREAMLVSLEAPWLAAKTIASRLEYAEEGLTSKLAERLGEVDPDWLAALVRESS